MPHQQSPGLDSPLALTQELLDVSVTELMGFRACRRRWGLQTLENLVPEHAEDYSLELGSGLHAALEAYYGSDVEDERDREHLAWEAWDEWATSAKDSVDSDHYEMVVDSIELGEAMLQNYFIFDPVSKVALGKVLAVEGRLVSKELALTVPQGYPPEAQASRHESGRILVPIVHPDTKELLVRASGLTPMLTARIDLVTERKTPKRGIWITDHKSAGQAPSDSGLDFDDQVTGYCYVTWRWTGTIPRGVVYNALIKNAPKEPRRVKQDKSNPTGLSTAKDQLTTPDLYRDALIEDGLMVKGRITSVKHAECLDALLARGWDPFFRRHEVTRNLEQLLSYERRLFEQYNDMVEAHLLAEKRYPSPNIRLCGFCSVKPICLAMEDGSDVDDVIEHRFIQGPDRKAQR